MEHNFKAQIYGIRINRCVDVPIKVTQQMTAMKGRINIKGQINGFHFTKTLMPVKNSNHRLFINEAMMKGGSTALGEIANFKIEQDKSKVVKDYLIPKKLVEYLDKNKLTKDFENLTESRKKDILKYLSYIKTEETLIKNINKLISQLKNREKNIRIP